MTVISLHDLFDGLAAYARDGISADGGLSLVLINGPLLIPLGVAAFFYPIEAALFGAVAPVAVALAGLALSRGGFSNPTRASVVTPPPVSNGAGT
jgi:hypothetical protein